MLFRSFHIKRKSLIAVLLIAIIALLLVAWRQGWLPNWTLETIRDFIQGFGVWAIVIYILLMALNTVTIMPPTLILIVLSGILFGPFVGSLALWTGLLIGSVAAFMIARLLAQDFVTRRLGGRAAVFNQRLATSGFSVVFIARVLGLPPYEIVNYASGLSQIKFRDFLLATMFGSIPGAILFAATGDRLLDPDPTDPVLYALPAFFIITLIVTRTAGWMKKRENNQQPVDNS